MCPDSEYRGTIICAIDRKYCNFGQSSKKDFDLNVDEKFSIFVIQVKIILCES